MKKHLNILKIMFYANIGVFIERSLYALFWYRNHPEIYMLNSAPWYTDIFVYGISAALIAVILGLAMWIIHNRMGKNN